MVGKMDVRDQMKPTNPSSNSAFTLRVLVCWFHLKGLKVSLQGRGRGKKSWPRTKDRKRKETGREKNFKKKLQTGLTKQPYFSTKIRLRFQSFKKELGFCTIYYFRGTTFVLKSFRKNISKSLELRPEVAGSSALEGTCLLCFRNLGAFFLRFLAFVQVHKYL